MTQPVTQPTWRESIPVDRLLRNPDNPRDDLGTPAELKELERSIRASGLKQRLVVVPALDKGGPDDVYYYIEDGERRYEATKRWMTELPCDVRPLRPGEDIHERFLTTALVTSEHQKKLNPIERAKAYARLRDEFRLNQVQIADRIGMTSGTVTNYLALLELAPNVQKQITAGKLSVADALQFVRRRRAIVRKARGGPGPMGAVWEPDHFTVNHPIARVAEEICNGRGHNNRRRRVKSKGFAGACDECWEDAIRADERTVVEATLRAAERWNTRANRPSPS